MDYPVSSLISVLEYVLTFEWFFSGNDISKLPPVCPQPNVDASTYSEDCLYMVVYTPVPSPTLGTSVPVLVWYVLLRHNTNKHSTHTGTGFTGALLWSDQLLERALTEQHWQSLQILLWSWSSTDLEL
jgi:hypothetical protein